MCFRLTEHQQDEKLWRLRCSPPARASSVMPSKNQQSTKFRSICFCRSTGFSCGHFLRSERCSWCFPEIGAPVGTAGEAAAAFPVLFPVRSAVPAGAWFPVPCSARPAQQFAWSQLICWEGGTETPALHTLPCAPCGQGCKLVCAGLENTGLQ